MTTAIRYGIKSSMRLFNRVPKEIYIYIMWGVIVGAVNLGSSWMFMYKFGIPAVFANVMAWVIYNYVSFVTNRISVFHTHTENIKQYIVQLFQFYASRVITLGVETGLIFLLVNMAGMFDMGVKLFTSILVIFMNYFISKKFIF